MIVRSAETINNNEQTGSKTERKKLIWEDMGRLEIKIKIDIKQREAVNWVHLNRGSNQ